MIMRKLSAGIAIAALLATGAAGIAGASSNGHGHQGNRVARIEAIAASGKLPASFRCASASKDLALIAKGESKIDVYLPKAAAREAAAVAAHQTKRAHVIAHRITEVQKFEAALVTVSSMIKTACPA
jgi:hypothetical protein